MASAEKNELLKEMVGIENRLRSGFGWDLFSKGVAKNYHHVLENESSSPQEIMQLFLRFLDERVNVIISVYKNIIENQLKGKNVLEEKADDLREQLKKVAQENNFLRELSNKHKEKIAALEARINYYEGRVDLIENQVLSTKTNTSKSTGLEQFVKELEARVAPMAPSVLKPSIETGGIGK